MSANLAIEPTLQRYDLGNKIRHLRRRKRMRLVDVQQHSGLSASLISKLESCKLVPTLPTLMRLANVFNVGLDFFFADEPGGNSAIVMRRPDRIRLPEKLGGDDEIFNFESLTFAVSEPPFEVFLGEIVADSTAARFHHHPGYELLYVMTGEVEVHIAEDIHSLAAGDSIYFDSSTPHTYRKTVPGKCSVFVVVTDDNTEATS
ncbi:MAG TPA: XRE family transcriptional regulator [Terriglobales bacterium]|nr:XRE family transcriptional regulator [Terriglobales bacterium]